MELEKERERGRGEEGREAREMRGERRSGRETANVLRRKGRREERERETQRERKVGDWKKEREKNTRKSEGVTIRGEVERQGGRRKMWNRGNKNLRQKKRERDRRDEREREREEITRVDSRVIYRYQPAAGIRQAELDS